MKDCRVGGLKGHVSPATHCNANIGRGEGRGVVDAIAHLGYEVPLSLKLADNMLLVLRQQFRPDFDAKLFANGRSGRQVYRPLPPKSILLAGLHQLYG